LDDFIKKIENDRNNKEVDIELFFKEKSTGNILNKLNQLLAKELTIREKGTASSRI
jgi:hypothetical protein